MRFDQYMICMLQVTETLPTPEPNSRLTADLDHRRLTVFRED